MSSSVADDVKVHNCQNLLCKKTCIEAEKEIDLLKSRKAAIDPSGEKYCIILCNQNDFLQEMIGGRDDHLAHLEAENAKQAAKKTLAKLEDEIYSRDQQIVELKQLIADHEERQHLQQEIDRFKHILKDMQSSLAEKEAESKTLTSCMARLEHEKKHGEAKKSHRTQGEEHLKQQVAVLTESNNSQVKLIEELSEKLHHEQKLREEEIKKLHAEIDHLMETMETMEEEFEIQHEDLSKRLEYTSPHISPEKGIRTTPQKENTPKKDGRTPVKREIFEDDLIRKVESPIITSLDDSHSGSEHLAMEFC